MYKPLQEGETQMLEGLSATKKAGQVLLSFTDYHLHQAVSYAYAQAPDPEFTKDPETRSKEPEFVDIGREFSPDELIDRLPFLEAWQSRHKNYSVGLFLRWLDLAQIDSDPIRLARIQSGLIAFDEIPWVLQEGAELYVPSGAWGGRLDEVTLSQGVGPPSWVLSIEVIASHQGLPTLCITEVRIPYFADIRPIASFAVAPITESEKTRLSARGAAFRTYASGAHYLAYQGSISVPGFFGPSYRRADGRLMVDGLTLASQDPNISRRLSARFEPISSHDRDLDDGDASHDPEPIEAGDLWRCWPSLPAFSFRAKTWGEVQVSHLSPIKFRSDAFDHLVLEPSLKTTIKALVEYSGTAFTDLVDDKSGGLIFLLEGAPGCGKTLTAEAVAEVLKRPLYSISVGELGTHPSELEDALRDILDMASRWEAVVLLDEADIFLEKRDEKDLVRNAMVGVFLRLLEYHNGVLFLTTNRVRNIDPAFNSRISITLPYGDLKQATRLAIWHSLLKATKLDYIDPSTYALHALNGRQIKNVLRLAQILARSEGRSVETKDIDRTLVLVLPKTTDPVPTSESTVPVDDQDPAPSVGKLPGAVVHC